MALGAEDVPQEWLTLDALVLVRKMRVKQVMQLPDVKQGEEGFLNGIIGEGWVGLEGRQCMCWCSM